MVNLGSSFEQSMIDRSLRCYIPSFVEICLLVLEKRFLKAFYHIYALRPSRSCDPGAANNPPPYPWRLHTKFCFDWLSLAVSEKMF